MSQLQGGTREASPHAIQIIGRERQHLRILESDDVGRALAPVDQRHLAEEVAGSEHGEAPVRLADPLHEADAAFLEELEQCLPDTVELVARDLDAEDPEFVREAVERLIALIEAPA